MVLRNCLAFFLLAGSLPAADLLDLAPSAQLSMWNGSEVRRLNRTQEAAGAANLGAEWDEERDVREIQVRYAGNAPTGASVEYWFQYWPYEPPKMPSFEDPMDDPWQGKWLKAAATETCQGADCRYTFSPLAKAENDYAPRLPGVLYRRTLKVRLVYPAAVPIIESLHIYSGSEQLPMKLRVDLGTAAGSSGVSVYNGILRSVKPWNSNGLLVELVAAKPDLPGSHDATVVTIRGQNTFSFMVDDLKHGSIVIPQFGARVIAEAPAQPYRLRVRERIPLEPEQTYERASREIPPLDPWDREWGGRVYLPLAPDSNWQKFAFEYGGDVFVSKTGIKAKGRELQRLQWKDDKIAWKIGTGANPYYREDHKVTVSKLEGYLPVVTQRWERDGIRYTEEAFATTLRGPLSPADKSRDEETPAILMLRLTAQNQSGSALKAHALLSVDSAGTLSLDGRVLRGDGKVVASLPALPNLTLDSTGVRIDFENSVVIKLPCVSDLSRQDVEDLNRLSYAPERERVIAYWKGVVDPAVRFTVPEPKFNLLAKSVVAEIHISTTKDPKTGLYMVPAASYGYDVFENESCYQVLLLDTLGQFDTAAAYLETMLRLQGSRNFPGLQKGPADGIFHGAKIDGVYDYTAAGYGLDHGTVLWTLAQHYLYSRDRTWLEHAWPHMRKAIEWIEEQRSATKQTDLQGQKVREYGLLPASQLEDNADWANWFSIDAFAWAGIERTAEALADAGNPESEKVRKQAEEYRNDLRAAVLRAVQSAPVARMQDGSYEPYVPVLPTRRFRLFGPIRAGYYDRYGRTEMKPLMRLGADRDTLCGAVVLLILGVFSPGEPIANWILNDWEDNETLSSGMGLNIHGMTDDRYWFSQGGMVFQANLVNPIQVYLWRHEAPAAIRNLYNDFVACLYPEVNMFTEEFHQWRHGSGPFYKISDEARFTNRVRDLLVLEQDDTLWLAAGAPRRWLSSKEGIDVRGVETFFGPVSYTLRAGAREGIIEATVQPPSRNPPKKTWLVVRVPRGHIQGVNLDGKPWTNIDPRLEAIEIPQRQGPVELEIRYGSN
jgi:hypothetical protein